MHISVLVLILLMAGCTQTPQLSITLVNPTTKTTQKCTAREGAARDVPALSSAVEMCARQLEARGYVRTSD
jgi:hypothetical protein